MAHIHGMHPRRTMMQQHIGEPTGGGPHIQANQPLG